MLSNSENTLKQTYSNKLTYIDSIIQTALLSYVVVLVVISAVTIYTTYTINHGSSNSSLSSHGLNDDINYKNISNNYKPIPTDLCSLISTFSQSIIWQISSTTLPQLTPIQLNENSIELNRLSSPIFTTEIDGLKYK